jgi:S-phase kinase-associated protein 1
VEAHTSLLALPAVVLFTVVVANQNVLQSCSPSLLVLTTNRNMTTAAANDDTTTIKLRSEDDQLFELPTNAANLSTFVSDALTEDDEGTDSEVKVLRVKGDCLKKVVEFLIKYKEEPMKEIPLPLGGNTFAEIVTQEWYQQFVADEVVDRDMLFALLTAANYMGIKPLLDLTCLKVTFELTGKNAEVSGVWIVGLGSKKRFSYVLLFQFI